MAQKELTLLKLEAEQKKEINRDRNLEEIEEDIVKKYQMKEGDYKVVVTVYEANDLEPRGTNFVIFKTEKTACDAFVEVTVRNKSKKTKVRTETNNPIFDEHMYFQFDNLAVCDLDSSKIVFTVYDKKSLIVTDAVMGQFQLDWTNVYFKRNHEIYRGWLSLNDPTDEFQGPVGYLLVNIAVLGPEDQVTVHDSAFIKDPLTTIEDTITSPKLRLIDFCLSIEIYRAENLVPIDMISREINAYGVVKFSGNKVQTSILSSLNPEWNELLLIGTGIPSKSKYVYIQVWNYNRLLPDDLVGVIKVSFNDICEGKNEQPRWGNLYGPPINGRDVKPHNYASKMQIYGDEVGSHYRGRVLFKIRGKKNIHTKNSKTELKFNFPFKPAPVVPLKSYTLQVDLIEGYHLPRRNQTYVHVGIGQYMIKSGLHRTVSSVCEIMETLEQKKVTFPQDPQFIPDIIVYVCDGLDEQNRTSFIRIKAASLITASKINEIKTYELKIDHSLGKMLPGQVAGFITLRINLFSKTPPRMTKIDQSYTHKIPYVLTVLLYRGEHFPPANQTGDCDAKIQFNCYGAKAESRTVSQSYNPIWAQMLTIEVEMQDLMATGIEKGLICRVLDEDDDKLNYIGNFSVQLSKKYAKKYKLSSTERLMMIYRHPQWCSIVNQHILIGNKTRGRVLLSCVLLRKEDFIKLPGDLFSRSLDVRSEKKTLQVYFVGLRDLEANNSKFIWQSKVSVKLSVGNAKIELPATTIKNGGCEFNKMHQVTIEVPKNKSLMPFVDIGICQQNSKSSKKVFLGFNAVNLYELLPSLANADESEKEEHSEDTLLDVEELTKQLIVVNQRKNQEKLLPAKPSKYRDIPAENLKPPQQIGRNFQHLIASSTSQDQKQGLIMEFENLLERDHDFEYIKAFENQFDEKNSGLTNVALNAIRDRRFENIIDNDSEQASLAPQLNEAGQTDRFGSKRESKIPNPISFESQALSYKELKSRFEIKETEESSQISEFGIKSDQVLTERKEEPKVIGYRDIEKAMKQEKIHEQLARQQEEEYKYAAAVKLTLFGWQREKRKREKQTYQDYDSEEGEDLNIIPAWYKNRKILMSDFEDLAYKNKKLCSIPIFVGRKAKDDTIETRIQESIGTLKVIMLSKKSSVALEKEKQYNKLLRPKSFYCRIYILKGKSLISHYDAKPTTYLRITYGADVIDLREKTLRKEEANPEYYICEEIPMDLPGPSLVKIEVMETYSILGKYFYKVLGTTEIDIEERYFMKQWHLYDRKPIELRNLSSDYGIGSQGRLQTWIELIEAKNWLSNPAYQIHPPPFGDYELRIVVWKTEDCVFKDVANESNDVFVRGVIGTNLPQQTDTHWRCRSTGSFNYRMKFPVKYPPKPEDMYSDVFVVQIWDKDVVGANNLIGETRINLNKIHKIIQKAVKRGKPVKASMRIKEKNLIITDRFWFEVFNHREKDQFGQLQPQGKVQLSFQLLPFAMAEKEFANGYGRADPNVYPTLADPVGRLSFDVLHPLDFLKEIIGPSMYSSICRKMIFGLCLLLLGAFLLAFGVDILAVLVAK